jgi:hypothetical protein
MKLMGKIMYVAALAAIVAYEHSTLGRRWRDYELARRALGIFTVMGWALPLAKNQKGLGAWTTAFAGFMVAGATKTALTLLENKDYPLLPPEMQLGEK